SRASSHRRSGSSARRSSRAGTRREAASGFFQGRDRADADVLALEELEPGRERLRGEELGQLVRQRLLLRVPLARGQVRLPEQLAEAAEEPRLEGGDGQEAPVGGRIDAVAGEAAGQQPREWLAAQAVRRQLVGAVRERDGEPDAAAGALPLEQRGEYPRDRAARAPRHIAAPNP